MLFENEEYCDYTIIMLFYDNVFSFGRRAGTRDCQSYEKWFCDENACVQCLDFGTIGWPMNAKEILISK